MRKGENWQAAILQQHDKKGVSAVVATVLIILIVVAAVSILWTFIIPMIKESTSFEESSVDLTISTLGGYTYWFASNQTACVQVKRGNDDANLTGIKVVFTVGGNSLKGYFEASKIPGPNEEKQDCFNLSGFGIPESVSVAAIIGTREGSIVSTIDYIPNATVGINLPSSQGGVSSDSRSTNGTSGRQESGNPSSPNNPGCTVMTCVELGKQCGSWPDTRCGGTLVCPACVTGTCNSTGQCVVAPSNIITVNACRDLDQAGKVYVQSANIVPYMDPCFKITASDITFDGNGFSIVNNSYGVNSIGGYAHLFNGSYQKNVVIKNTNISLYSNPTGGGATAVFVDGFNNSLIFNNTIRNVYGAIFFLTHTEVTSYNNNIIGNVINNQSTMNTAIQLGACSGSNISNNNISNGGGNIGFGSNAYGSYNYQWNVNRAFSLAVNTTITNCYAYNISGIGVSIGDNSTASNIYLENCSSGSSSTTSCISFTGSNYVNSVGGKFINSVINGTRGPWFAGGGSPNMGLNTTYNNLVKDVSLIGTPAVNSSMFGYYTPYACMGGVCWAYAVNTTLLNVIGYDSSKEYVGPGSNVTRKWYVDVLVTDAGVPAQGANVSILASNPVNGAPTSPQVYASGITGSDGIVRLNGIQYVNNNGTKTTYGSVGTHMIGVVKGTKVGSYSVPGLGVLNGNLIGGSKITIPIA